MSRPIVNERHAAGSSSRQYEEVKGKPQVWKPVHKDLLKDIACRGHNSRRGANSHGHSRAHRRDDGRNGAQSFSDKAGLSAEAGILGEHPAEVQGRENVNQPGQKDNAADPVASLSRRISHDRKRLGRDHEAQGNTYEQNPLEGRALPFNA